VACARYRAPVQEDEINKDPGKSHLLEKNGTETDGRPPLEPIQARDASVGASASMASGRQRTNRSQISVIDS
jgi:hypothetical protein